MSYPLILRAVVDSFKEEVKRTIGEDDWDKARTNEKKQFVLQFFGPELTEEHAAFIIGCDDRITRRYLNKPAHPSDFNIEDVKDALVWWNHRYERDPKLDEVVDLYIKLQS